MIKSNISLLHFGKLLGIIQVCCLFFVLSTGVLSAATGQVFQKVSLAVENVEIREVLKTIKQQTKYDFVYNANDINDKRLVSLKLDNADLETALKACFKDSDINFLVKDKIIILQKQTPQVTDQVVPRVMSGKVVDVNGDPLAGVSVILKGTYIGVATNAKGEFLMKIAKVDGPVNLVFTFMGMEPVVYTVKEQNKKNIRIVMKDDTKNLEEVVVTGMETVKKDRMTGSVATVTAKDLQMQGITSIDRILDGMVAGLNSTTVSGAPGTRSKITIRGENNLSGNTEPLWIIDGLPMMTGVPKTTAGDYAGTIMQDGVGNVMPEDIESITILKDASATAIYGARAANGVIVITTKKGFRSKTQISYSATFDCSTAPKNNLDFMNSTEKVSYEQSLIDNFGLSKADNAGRTGFLYKRMLKGHITPEQYQAELERMRNTNTDWFDVLFRTAFSHRHNISLRGGNEDLTYYTSINYSQQNGILLSNQYENAGLMLKLDYRPLKNMILALNVSVSTRKNRDHASNVNPFKYAMFANPYERPYNEDGSYAADLTFLSDNYTSETASGYIYDSYNVVKELTNTRSLQDGLDATLTLNFKYDIMPGLSFQSNIRKGVSTNTSTQTVDPGTYASYTGERFARLAFKNASLLPAPYDNGSMSESAGKNFNWSIRNQIDYSFKIRKDHLFTVMLANEISSKKFNNFGYKSPIYDAEYRITGVPVFNKEVNYEDLRGAISGLFNTSQNQDRSVSFLGSLRYGYKDKYVANFTYRADGADVIGNANRFTPLWSVGLRYNLHKEKFFQNNIITELALRASFGYTGNIDRSTLPFATITIGNGTYMGDHYASQYTFPNTSVKWEKKQDRGFGIDMGLFKSRINLGIDYYSNRTEDILEQVQVPPSTGRTSGVKINGGIVENSGLEFSLNVRWIQRSDVSFSSSFNLSKNKNVIKKSQHNFDSWKEVIAHNSTKGGQVNINGQETGGIYGWKTAGVNPVSGNPRYYLTDDAKRHYAELLDEWETLPAYRIRQYGKAMHEFQTVPDIVDAVRTQSSMPYLMPSMQYLGRSNPKFVGGFSTSFRWKNLSVNTNWTYKVGNIIPKFQDYQNAPGGSRYYANDFEVSSTNRERKYLYYWKAPGDITDVAGFVNGNDYWAGYTRSEDYEKGDFVRMTNLAISYRIPRHLVDRMGLQNCSVGLNIRNLLTFTKYSGLDVATGGSFSYPAAKSFNFRLSLGF